MQSQYDRFERLCRGLSRADAYPGLAPGTRVERIETHISVVFLAGDHAYKLKKPLDLGFLDFTDAERRRYYCEEEIRLNRRTAPDIYLNTVPVTGEIDAPRVGGRGVPLEWAVRMRRFDQQALLSVRAGSLSGAQFDALGAMVAGFHLSACRRPPQRDAVAAALDPALHNFRALADAGPVALEPGVGPIEGWTRRTAAELAPLMRAREADGFVRECHGDLHLNNLLLREGRFQAFDGIEFDPALRWIDTMSDLAFLLMDLDHHGIEAGRRRVLNAYLEDTGDYDGTALLPFYLAYRAMVRAKVAALRTAQGSEEDVRGYLDLAERYAEKPTGALVLTGGVSGTGKSTLALALVDKAGFIRLRTDVERKRLAGLSPLDRRPVPVGTDLYSPAMTARTYEHVAATAAGLLRRGHAVVIDASFLEARWRQRFRDLAEAEGVAFRLLWLEVPESILRERVRTRAAQGRDASDADETVLFHQLRTLEPPDELGAPELIRNPGPDIVERLAALLQRG